jgi:hypothetical protein
MSDKGKYGEPWSIEQEYRADELVVRDHEGAFHFAASALDGPFGEKTGNDARRIVRCVNLLAAVPDDAPCFRPTKSDAVQLAIAVLSGDETAAAALADEVVATIRGLEGAVKQELERFAEFATNEADLIVKGYSSDPWDRGYVKAMRTMAHLLRGGTHSEKEATT